MTTATEKLFGFGKNTETTQRMIGELVLAARQEEPPPRWKDLEIRYQRERSTLWRYARLVALAHKSESKVVANATSATLATTKE